MKSFSEHIDEALVVVGKKPYPKFGNVVILAGGAGSGKGFIKDKLIAIEGKTFDVDEIKGLILKVPKLRQAFKDVIQNMYKNGKISEIPDVDNDKVRATILKKPQFVQALHIANKNIGLSSRIEARFFADMLNRDPNKRPNIIYDVTLKDMIKLRNISQKLTTYGYKKENIHLVWICNDIKVAVEQNQERPRVVPADILLATHEGASRTMADVLKLGKNLKKYLDGDIIIVPNKRDVDSKWLQNKNGGGYFVFADNYKIKESGKAVDLKKITTALEKEIKSYVPKGTFKV